LYRFIRSARIKDTAHMPAALQFATEVTAYLNKQYALNMKLGVETLDQPIIQWHFDLESADELAKLNDKLMEDQEYSALIEKYKNAWFAKSMKDVLVTVAP
jgi:predicted RNA binding protein with dsRBD fold (UPF0201 family)